MAKTIRKVMPGKLQLPKLLKVAAYARVSSGKDAMLHSLSAQVSYYSELIQKNPSWTYVGVYADEAITGTKDAREQYQCLMADCRAGKIDMVITKSISRLARNTVTLLETVRELKQLGVDIYFEEQNIHSISGDGELMLTILASYAQEESLSASENRKWQIRNHYENGQHATWQFMYGFRIKHGTVCIHEEEAQVVRWIFDSYLDGMAVSEIAATLREQNIPSHRGGTWTPKRLDELIKNEKYAGDSIQQKKYVADHITKKLVINRGELPKYSVTDSHPAIIDRETYKMAMFKMALNRARFTKPIKAPLGPFAGIIRCPHCGKNYRRKTSKKGNTTYNCATYLTMGKAYCHTKGIPEDQLLDITTSVLGIEKFDENVLHERIEMILVPGFNSLVYVFKDGTQVERTWQDRSRSESWTEEMRKAAAEHYRRREAV